MSEKWERWGVAEADILKKHYFSMPKHELMPLLPGRTWKAITGAADRFGFSRKRSIPMTEAALALLRTRLSIARSLRDGAPFAGCTHTAESKIAISVSNLHTRGHTIAAIAERNGIAEAAVEEILKKRDERNKIKR